MLGRVLVNMIIIPAVILTLSNGIVNKSFANEEKNKTEYVISQSEESKFLEDIYKTETDLLKIKSIDKKVSDQNYMNKEIVETKTLNKSNEDYIRNQFGETKEFNDGTYKGVLSISNIDVQTIKNGYYEKIDEQVLSFENFTDNDLNNIEKEIDINNVRYYLINVEWEPENTQAIDNENVPTTYKERKIYQTVKTLANPDTYKVTVTYTGKAEKVDTVYDYKINYEKKVQEPVEEPKVETKKIDLSKYDYYEESINGSYKGFVRDDTEMSKLKSLIDTCISEFGYTNVKIVQDSSLARSGLRSFTANKTNVENAVYDSDGFTICYYAVKEYHISNDGTESLFQTRSYIKVK